VLSFHLIYARSSLGVTFLQNFSFFPNQRLLVRSLILLYPLLRGLRESWKYPRSPLLFRLDRLVYISAEFTVPSPFKTGSLPPQFKCLLPGALRQMASLAAGVIVRPFLKDVLIDTRTLLGSRFFPPLDVLREGILAGSLDFVHLYDHFLSHPLSHDKRTLLLSWNYGFDTSQPHPTLFYFLSSKRVILLRLRVSLALLLVFTTFFQLRSRG